MTNEATPPTVPAAPARTAQPRRRRSPADSPSLRIAVAVAAVIVIALVWRHRSLATRAQAGAADSIPIVAAEKVQREDLAQTLTVAAEFRPNQQVALHSKVSGYVQSIWVDVGDHVQEGQAIAQLDVPEMQNEL